jgi:hypothetical protein
MNNADLSFLLLGIADSLERQVQGASAGVLRQAARRLAELHVDEPGVDRCAGCGNAIVQPRTGRRRRWCGRGRCESRTRENAKVSA